MFDVFKRWCKIFDRPYQPKPGDRGILVLPVSELPKNFDITKVAPQGPPASTR